MKHLPALLLLLVLPAWAAAAPPAKLKLATWNLEWLMTPQTQGELREACRAGRGNRLPCDVVLTRARTAADYDALARHARALDADVIALQEVEGERAAARVLRGYDYCFSARRDRQNLGFAIRRGLDHRCEPDLTALSVDDRVRRGVAVTLFPGTPQEMALLTVHLKSGCARDPLAGGRGNCGLLARQAAPLAEWIDAAVASGRAFAVLGDFNRDLRGERNGRASADGLWRRIADGRPRPEGLVDASGDAPFRACHSGQTFTTYIDYILLGGPLAARMAPGSFTRHPFRDADAHRYRLSDHCPLSVVVRLR